MRENNKVVLNLELPAKKYPYPDLRIITQDLIKTFMSVSERWVQRIELIVDELINNAAEHGSAPEDYINIVFRITDDNLIKICVEDKGTGEKSDIDHIKNHIEKHRSLGTMDNLTNITVRGRGLAHIVTKWSDSWTIEKNKKGGITFESTINTNCIN